MGNYMEIFDAQELAERRADRASQLPERGHDASPGRSERQRS